MIADIHDAIQSAKRRARARAHMLCKHCSGRLGFREQLTVGILGPQLCSCCGHVWPASSVGLYQRYTSIHEAGD